MRVWRLVGGRPAFWPRGASSAAPSGLASALLVAALALAAPTGVRTAAAVTLAGASGPGDETLMSHRAAYRLNLRSAEQQSGINAVQGGLVVEWQASCDGYISNQRLGFVAATTEGPGFSYDVRFSSFEAKDLRSMRFAMRTFDDGELSDEARGQATFATAGGSGTVAFDMPAGGTLDLPAGTLFPTEHVRALIDAARGGEHFVSHDVFDGSGEDGLNRVTAVIGEPATSGDGLRSWPVSLAYYAADPAETAPDFELSFKLNEVGVFDDVLLDYGDFALRGELEKLETLPTPSCE